MNKSKKNENNGAWFYGTFGIGITIGILFCFYTIFKVIHKEANKLPTISVQYIDDIKAEYDYFEIDYPIKIGDTIAIARIVEGGVSEVYVCHNPQMHPDDSVWTTYRLVR